jgi:hypothetical protein
MLLVTQGYRDRVGEDLVTSRMVVKACWFLIWNWSWFPFALCCCPSQCLHGSGVPQPLRVLILLVLTSFPALGIGFFPQQVFCCFLQSLADVCGVSVGIPLELKEGTESLTEQRWSYSEEEQLEQLLNGQICMISFSSERTHGGDLVYICMCFWFPHCCCLLWDR